MTIILLVISILILCMLVYIAFIKKDDNSGVISQISSNISGKLDESTKSSSRELREEINNTIQKSQETQISLYNQQAKNQNEQISQLTDRQSDKMQELIQSNSNFQEKILNALNSSLQSMQDSNEKKLDKIQETVNEKLDKTLNSRLDSSFKQIGDQLGDLYKSLGELNKLSTGVTDLNKTLSNVKTRGTWGEVQLQAILEQTMIPSQYATNVATKKKSKDRVEFAIKIPSKDDKDDFLYLPIDSKMPTDLYNKIITASENADVAGVSAAMKELKQKIKTEARTIRDKYIDPPNTTDFAIMFLPTESLYAEVLRIDGLMEWCQNDCKIVISGPSTITALLNSLRLGFSNLALNRKSKDVLKLLQAIKTQYGTLSRLIESTQTKLSAASSETEKLKERTDIIQRRMSKIEQLDISEANDILGLPNNDED